MKSTKILLFTLLLPFFIKGQQIENHANTEVYWQDQVQGLSYLHVNADELPSRFRALQIDVEAIKTQLQTAPKKFSAAAKTSNVKIALPLPSGGFKTFKMMKTEPMHPDLAAKFPDIQNWHGLCIEDGISAVALTISPVGLSAMIKTAEFKSVLIEPIRHSTFNTYIAYHEMDKEQPVVACMYEHTLEETLSREIPNSLPDENIRMSPVNHIGALGDKLRTHRLALAANSEFSALHGDSPMSVSAKLSEFVNIQNLLYIREVSIRFQLVSNNDRIIFINGQNSDMPPVLDPYAGLTNGEQLNAANQATIDTIIGKHNYDIGHLMNTISGLAGGPPCSNVKADGSSQASRSLNHEIGHQFGCPHTNGIGSGSVNYQATGVGNTVMGRNDALGNDDYFHLSSSLQIASMIEQENFCITGTATNNTIPVVTVGEGGMHIPKSTPFQLAGTAYDPDPNTTLLYNWQQYNDDGSFTTANGEIVPQNNYPLFRDFFPTPDGNVRIFPKMADIINDNHPFSIRFFNGQPYRVYHERLPTYTRNLKFRLVARDYELTGGAFDYEELSFEVDGNAGPFLVTAPNEESDVWIVGNTANVTWDVAGTDQVPVSCDIVDILLSVDGGWTYPYTLAEGRPNNGTASISLPDGISETNQARVKIECASYENVRFFDISDNNFTINSACQANGGILTPAAAVSAPVGNSELNLNLTTLYRESPNQVIFEIGDNNPNGFFPEFNSDMECNSSTSSLNYQLFSFQVDKTGNYSFTLNNDPSLDDAIYLALYSDYNGATMATICDNFVTTNVSAAGGVSTRGSITVSLTAGTNYEMIVHRGFGSGGNTVTGTVSFTSDVEGQIVLGTADNPPSPALDYAYTYVAVNPTSNIIVAINADANFMNLGGGTYHVYGLSYKSANSPPAIVNPNSFLNQNINDVRNNGQCASFSENYVPLEAQDCNLIAVLPNETSPCSNGVYDQVVKIIYERAPQNGNLSINGQIFPITGSPQYETLTNLPVDGQPVDITANFTDDPNCSFSLEAAFAPPSADLVAGQSMEFNQENGESEYIKLLNLSQMTNQLTLSAWIKRNGNQNQYSGIIHSETGRSGLNFGSNNQLGFHWNGDLWYWDSGLTVPDNEWTHVAMVANGNNITLYVNGIAAVNNGTPALTDFSNVVLGIYPVFGNRNFRGLMDDVRIINRALSQQEIREQMHIIADICDSDLLAYIQFNETGELRDQTNNSTPQVIGGVIPVASAAPVAAGTAVTKTVATTGNVDFNTDADANVKINFGANPNGDVVVSHLISEGPHGTPASSDPLADNYWIVRNYGTNNSNLNASMVFQDPNWIINNTAADYQLYKRASNSTGNWDAPIIANNANSGTGEVTFNGINSFSQFIIERNPNISGCIITGVTAGSQSACDMNTNTYSQDISVTYNSPPASGQLIVNGQAFSITGSPQTLTLTNLTANGQAVNATASFSDAPSCSFTNNAAFTAPAACNTGSSCTTYHSTDTPIDISIPDASTITSTINVPTGGMISDINVRVKGLHTWISDLSFSLTSPMGTIVTLINNQCNDMDDFDLTLDDEAASGISCPYNEGNTQRPDNSLSEFDNQDMAGDWLLTIIDGVNDDGGELTEWSIEICTGGGSGTCTSSPPASGTIAANTYHVATAIVTSGRVLAPSNVVLKAGNSINLNPNFEVELGATFEALIEDCSNVQDNETVDYRSTKTTDKLEPRLSENLQIYPNPFTHQTTISYHIEASTDVTVLLYNMNGQVVKELVSHAQQAAGNYQVDFQAQQETEGVYFVVFKTSDRIISKRMVLMAN